MSASRKGKHLSPEHRANISAAVKKLYEDPAERQKLSVAQKKRYSDKREREKISNKLMGHPSYVRTEEIRARISESVKKYYADHPGFSKQLVEIKKQNAARRKEQADNDAAQTELEFDD